MQSTEMKKKKSNSIKNVRFLAALFLDKLFDSFICKLLALE